MKALRWVLSGLLVLALLVLGGVVVLDRPLRSGVERAIANQLVTELGLPTAPSISIGGWPFAWYALLRSFPSASVEIDELTADTEFGPVTLQHINLDMVDARTVDQGLHAGSVNGTVLVPWATVESLAGMPIGDGGSGRLRVDVSAVILQTTMTGSLSGVPVLDVASQTVTVEQPQVEISGAKIPSVVTQWVIDRFVPSIPLELPYGLKATSVEAREPGLTVGLTGTDITLTDEG